jgi:hypothetical protein
MTFRLMLGNQLVALPKKLRGFFTHGFADAPSKRVIAIAGGLPVRLGEADQPMLTVVTVFSDKLLALTTSFTDQVAKGVIVVVMIALDHQAIARDDVRPRALVHQQVARWVVAETFLHVLRMVGAGEAGEGVVVVVVLAFAGVEQAGEVAGLVVIVLALVKGACLLSDGVGVQAVLVVVVVVAEQLALLALVLAAVLKQV